MQVASKNKSTKQKKLSVRENLDDGRFEEKCKDDEEVQQKSGDKNRQATLAKDDKARRRNPCTVHESSWF